MSYSLEQFRLSNGIDKDGLREFLYRNGVKESDLIVIDFLQGSPSYSDFHNPIGDTRKYLSEVNKYIKKNQNIYIPKYMIFFHSTAKNLQDKILKEGLLPTSTTRRRSYQSTNGYVYLASRVDRAREFGMLGNGNNICMFAVLVKTTDIRIDMDQLRNKKIAYAQYNSEGEIKETLADSIWYGGGVRVKGMIQPYQLMLME